MIETLSYRDNNAMIIHSKGMVDIYNNIINAAHQTHRIGQIYNFFWKPNQPSE